MDQGHLIYMCVAKDRLNKCVTVSPRLNPFFALILVPKASTHLSA